MVYFSLYLNLITEFVRKDKNFSSSDCPTKLSLNWELPMGLILTKSKLCVHFLRKFYEI
jgi:hypothetical protein